MDHFDPDKTHITDDYGDLGLSMRHDGQLLLEESMAVGVVMGHYDGDLSIAGFLTLSLVNEVFQTGTWSLSCNAQGRVEPVEFSSGLRRMIGYTDPAEFPNSGDTYLSIIHPNDIEMVKATIEAAIKDVCNDFNLDITYRVRIRDGAYVWLRSVGAASVAWTARTAVNPFGACIV